MIRYQFEITIKTCYQVLATSSEDAEQMVDPWMDTMLDGCELGNEVTNNTFFVRFSQQYTGEIYPFEIHCDFPTLLVEASTIEASEKLVPGIVREKLAGSPLGDREYTLTFKLSEKEQQGLDELLSWIDDNDPFIASAFGTQYHYACAVDIFGKRRMAWVCAGHDDDIKVTYGDTWKTDMWNHMLNHEDMNTYCDGCTGNVYEEPKESEPQDA